LSLTVNGLGERAGNASLEEIAMMLRQVFCIEKYDNTQLFALCNYVSEVSGRPIPEMKPVCGRWACSHESGIHVRGTLSEPLAFQPFDGKSAVRESTELLLGKHSGKSAVINALRQNGVECNEEKVGGVLGKIKEVASREKRCVGEDEVF
jgi:homocitrate synthase NifV